MVIPGNRRQSPNDEEKNVDEVGFVSSSPRSLAVVVGRTLVDHHHKSWCHRTTMMPAIMHLFTSTSSSTTTTTTARSSLQAIIMDEKEEEEEEEPDRRPPSSSFPSYLSTRKITPHLSWWRATSTTNNGHRHILLMMLLHISFTMLLWPGSNVVQCSDTILYNDLEQTPQSSLCHISEALGMESGAIPDSALSASSSYQEESVGPQNARLNRELNAGAWCPSGLIDKKNSGHEWIQVNLSVPHVITKIATQGRFGNAMGREFTEQFYLDYTRDGQHWTRWRNQYGEEEIRGNSDTYSIAETNLSIPLVGVTAIRLLPVSQYTRTCCVRFEIYGCLYKDGPISYSMMDGQFNGRFGDLIDDTYDGFRSETGFLSGGLGQLVDGIKGDDDYKVNKGFEWIGWRANTQSQLTITFQFDDVRNFSTAIFHCHNMFTKDIQVFYSAKIWFSLDGHRWSPIPEDFEYAPDNVMELARDVIIHLHHRIGRFVKFDFRFAAKWLLMSEAKFESTPVNRGLSINELDFVDVGPITTTPIQTNRSTFNEIFVFLALGALATLLAFFMIILLWFTRKRKAKPGSEYTTVPLKDVSPPPLYCEPNDLNGPFTSNGGGGDPEYAVPELIGNGPTTFLNLNATDKQPNGNLIINPMSYCPSPVRCAPIQAPSPNWTVANQKKTAAAAADNDDDGKARYYASTDVLTRNNDLLTRPLAMMNSFGPNGYCSALANGPRHLVPTAVPPPIQNGFKLDSPPSSLSSNTSKGPKLNSSNSTSLESYENTPVHSSLKSASPVSALQNIPLLNEKEVTIIDGHFGYSKFGDCELGYLLRKNEKRLIILKTLSGDLKSFQEEFMQEMNEKWRLSNEFPKRLARLYGFISRYDYTAMAIEYGDFDLKKFLRTCTPSMIGPGELIGIALQIAEAMDELHVKGCTHRDMAARNCLIYIDTLKVKITHSGALIKEYKNEYFQEIFPIRWMSYECIVDSKYTKASDVYAFGVTLWEIMKYCQSLPHQLLSDEDIISEMFNENSSSNQKNYDTFYNHPFSDSNPKDVLRLPKPTKDCPDEIYDLIVECTQRCEESRPKSHEIVHFLKRQNLSFRKI